MQRKLYASCTRAGVVRRSASTSLPASSARRRAATVPCPVCGRAACMRWSKATGVPSSASSVIAPATSARPASRVARQSASAPTAVSACVPLSSARPSFASRRTGSMPARCRASQTRQALAAIHRFAFADHAKRQVGQRREIAARADRSLRRNHGVHAAIQHLRQRLGEHRAHAAVAERQRIGAQGHHHARLRFGERRAQPAGVAAHQIELQAVEVVTGNAHFAQLAEAGIDAVDRQVICGRPAHHLARGLHLGDRGGAIRICAEASAMAAISRKRKRLSAEFHHSGRIIAP